MATELYIEEYSGLTRGQQGALMPVPDALIAKQKVAIGAGSVNSAALNTNTRYVVLTADVACRWDEAAAPTADATSRYLPADLPRSYKVTGGNLIAVINQL